VVFRAFRITSPRLQWTGRVGVLCASPMALVIRRQVNPAAIRRAVPPGAEAKGAGHLGGSDDSVARKWSTRLVGATEMRVRRRRTGCCCYGSTPCRSANGAAAPDSGRCRPRPRTRRFHCRHSFWISAPPDPLDLLPPVRTGGAARTERRSVSEPPGYYYTVLASRQLRQALV